MTSLTDNRFTFDQTRRETIDRRCRGSVLIIAIFFAAVLSLLLGSLISYSSSVNKTAYRSSLKELALHLAESGIEIGIHELRSGGINGGFQKWENLSYFLGNHLAELDVVVISSSTESNAYDVYSLVTIPFKGSELQRAVKVTVKADFTDSSEDEGGQQFAYGIIARDQITIQHGNGDKRPRFASYDSESVTNPSWETDADYSVMIATPNDDDRAINVNNAIIRGAVNSGGGSISYDSGYTNSNQSEQNLWLGLSSDDDAEGINLDGLQNSFNGEVNDPEYPDGVGMLTPAGQSDVSESEFWSQNDNDIDYGIGQNYWQNGEGATSDEGLFSSSGNTRTIGMTGEQSLLTTPSINLQNGSTLNIKGEVVLYVKRNFNIHGDISFEDGASLELIASQNNHFTGSTDNEKPIQFIVTPYVDLSDTSPSGPNVQFNNTDRVAMVINAPYSKVSTGGQGNTNFDYLGAIIADQFNCPNGVRFFYDVSLAADSEDDVNAWESGDPDYQVVDWSELLAPNVVSLMDELGVDS